LASSAQKGSGVSISHNLLPTFGALEALVDTASAHVGLCLRTLYVLAALITAILLFPTGLA
jgi:hypothetical protein